MKKRLGKRIHQAMPSMQVARACYCIKVCEDTSKQVLVMARHYVGV